MLLPPNLAAQLKICNTKGLLGHNISCYLHNEHPNRLVKVGIEGLGPNKSERAITRASRAIGVLSDVTTTYDQVVGLSVPL